jgi:hypothetical protein
MKWQGFPNWPPQWAGAYGPGTKFPIGDVGVLKGVRAMPASPAGPAHLTLVIEYEGRRFEGALMVDDAAVLEPLRLRLLEWIDRPLQEVGAMDIDL